MPLKSEEEIRNEIAETEDKILKAVNIKGDNDHAAALLSMYNRALHWVLGE